MMQVRPEIKKLAEILFDSEELEYIKKISQAICGSKKQRGLAIYILRKMNPIRPKRPLYYLDYSLKNLPMLSRNAIEEVGSYIDLLIKEFRYEIEGKYREFPLGSNIEYLLGKKLKLDLDLIMLLEKVRFLNKWAYVPAKHIYGSPNDTEHYFKDPEVAIIVLAVIKLGEELKSKSKYVRTLCQDLVLPGQGLIIGHHPRTDNYGAPFDFKKKLSVEVIKLETEEQY